MEKLNEDFMKGAQERGHSKEKLIKIWNDWKKFAEYAFNKSHATCYAWVGYQTGYLKAHYPAEFLAANLSKNLNNMDEITKLMDDCRRMKISVLGPDVNESSTRFAVNKDGNIRFGMAGIKGVGANVIDTIVSTRESGGLFKDIFDFVERVPAGIVNRKTMECLAYSGAFDCFSEVRRVQYFLPSTKGEAFIDAVIRYAAKYQNDTIMSGANLFGTIEELKPVRPEIPFPQDVNEMELLKKEKELVGMYLSSHPLDRFKFEIDNFATTPLSEVQVIEANLQKDKNLQNKEFTVAGLITDIKVNLTKNNRQWCRFTIEDFSGSHSFSLFGKDYESFMKYMVNNTALLVKCATQLRYAKKDEAASYEVKIRSMALLSNTKEDFIKEFHIVIPDDRLTVGFRSALMKELKRHKGSAQLYVNVIFHAEGEEQSVEFVSKHVKVTPSYELFDWLDKEGLRYSFPKKIKI